MAIEIIKIWKEGKRIVIRNDEHHITTYGKTIKEAIRNFYEAYLLNVSEEKESPVRIKDMTITTLKLPSVENYGPETTAIISQRAH